MTIKGGATSLAKLDFGAGRVLVPHGSGYPEQLVDELTKAKDVDLELVHNRIDAPLRYVTDADELIGHRALMVGAATRSGVQSGRFSFVPNSFGLTPRLFRAGHVGLDAVLVHTSPPDEDGWMTYGTCTSHLPAAIEASPVVVAQINERMPVTRGERLHLEEVSASIRVNQPLVQAPHHGADSPLVQRMAEHIQSWVPDRAYLQLGIGMLANAVLGELGKSKKTFALWTETFGDSAVELMRQGRILPLEDGAPAITATFVTARESTYEALPAMKDVFFRRVEETNSPRLIAGLGRPFRAINSAIEIDLSGQVNAESIGGRIYSGPGGQLDFAIGASLHPDGKGIWVLPSQTGRGVSRIVAEIGRGNAVTVPRTLTGVVVTEYGAVDLEGLSLEERAAQLIGIAHPEHRERLRAEFVSSTSRD